MTLVIHIYTNAYTNRLTKVHISCETGGVSFLRHVANLLGLCAGGLWNCGRLECFVSLLRILARDLHETLETGRRTDQLYCSSHTLPGGSVYLVNGVVLEGSL
jgi:hypothetical protein